MPKSLYKAISRTFDPHDSAPVWASKSQRAAFHSNLQITKKLLCGKCEDRFNKNGEKYVLHQCMKSAHKFELKKLLSSSSPSVQVNGSFYFHPDDFANLNVDKYLYFVASIAWRVTITDWGSDDIAKLHGALPAEFMESIKRYLLGDTDFPKNVYVTVCVDNDENPIPIMSLPSGELTENMHMSFFIPGVKFNIFFGEKADPLVAYHFDRLATNVLFMYRSFRGSVEFQQMRQLLVSDVVPKGKLAKAIKGTR